MCQFPVKITTRVPWIFGWTRSIDLNVPCGKCLECRKKRANEWSFRLEEERKDWQHCAFITLTYRDGRLPVFDGERVKVGRQNRGYSTLYKPDLQKFFKRLRYKKYGLLRFKYFAVGEYGPNGTVRPHYHILLFYNGVAPEELYSTISKVWHKGRITCTSATSGRISYCCKYCCYTKSVATERHTAPFMVCSNRNPIGYSWLSSSLARLCSLRGQEFIKRSFVNSEGQRISYNFRIPRYYLRKMDFGKTWDELTEVNFKNHIKELFGIPKQKVYLTPKLQVDTSYYQLCRKTYDDLVKSHLKRDESQHIRFSFSDFIKTTHDFVLNNKPKFNPHVYFQHCKDYSPETNCL